MKRLYIIHQCHSMGRHPKAAKVLSTASTIPVSELPTAAVIDGTELKYVMTAQNPLAYNVNFKFN